MHVIWPLLSRRERDGRSSVLAADRVRAVLGWSCSVDRRALRAGETIFRNETGVLTALGPSDRAAMQWMAAHTDSSARVLVLTNSPWQIDKVSEWFPVLAQRRSVATVQGSEWLPHRAFDTFIARQPRVAACANGADSHASIRSREIPRCIHSRVRSQRRGWRCCRSLLGALRRDPRYQVIHDD